MSDLDSLDFIRDIQVAQFWRDKLGDEAYHYYDPKDLRRWYEAMDLMGAPELRHYIIERQGRFPRNVVTGIAAQAPHPPLALVEIWLAENEKRSYMPQAFMSLMAFGVGSFFLVTNLHSCQLAQPPNQLAQFQPQAAVLSMGGNNGLPAPTSTLPTSLAGVPAPWIQPVGISVQGFQPNSPGMKAQVGTAGATLGGGGLGGMNPFSGQGGASGMPAGSQRLSGTLPGGGIASPGPSAFGASGTASAPTMHTANSGSSANLTGTGGAPH